MSQLILASASPRRQALLKLLHLPFVVQAADVDEDLIRDRDPKLNVSRRAQLKAHGIELPATQEALIIAADTTVTIDGLMLNKPADAAEAKKMLQLLCGRQHQVYTAIALLHTQTGKIVNDVDAVNVYMRPYTNAEIDAYIATGDPMDKAGAYAIQHPQFNPVNNLEGCYLTVMGLSVCRLITLLAQFSIPISVDIDALEMAHQNHGCPLLSTVTK